MSWGFALVDFYLDWRMSGRGRMGSMAILCSEYYLALLSALLEWHLDR